MQALFTKTVFTMHPGSACWFRATRAQRLRLDAAHGPDVWITVEGRGGDHWLRAGDDIALLAGDRLLLSVQSNARGSVQMTLMTENTAPQNALRGLARLARIWQRLRLWKGAPAVVNA